MEQELNAMLAEASLETEPAPVPAQYQTNYREEYQYFGPTTDRWVCISQHFDY